MQAVRKRILEILKRRKSATVGELARQLDMAPVSVRYHLDILQGDDLIEVSKVRREGSVGRPKQVYSLTQGAAEHFPDNFAALTAGLVRQMKKHLPPNQLEGAFCGLAREMAAELSSASQQDDARPMLGMSSAEIESRLDDVVSFLNERGYLARWEPRQSEEDATATADGYLLHTFNCPYAGVSAEHPELCQMDLELVRSLLDSSCQRVETIAEEGRCCTYRFEGNPGAVLSTVDQSDIENLGIDGPARGSCCRAAATVSPIELDRS